MRLDETESSHLPDAFPLEERRGLYRAIYTRRDIRHFRDDPVPDEVLARIIQAAHQGPSVGFMQPWDLILIRDLTVRGQIKDLFERERQAAAFPIPVPEAGRHPGIAGQPVYNLRPDQGRRGARAQLHSGD